MFELQEKSRLDRYENILKIERNFIKTFHLDLKSTKRIVKDGFMHRFPKSQILNSKDFISLFPFKNYMSHVSFYAKSKAKWNLGDI